MPAINGSWQPESVAATCGTGSSSPKSILEYARKNGAA